MTTSNSIKVNACVESMTLPGRDRGTADPEVPRVLNDNGMRRLYEANLRVQGGTRRSPTCSSTNKAMALVLPADWESIGLNLGLRRRGHIIVPPVRG
jgi:hypothetical protein